MAPASRNVAKLLERLEGDQQLLRELLSVFCKHGQNNVAQLAGHGLAWSFATHASKEMLGSRPDW